MLLCVLENLVVHSIGQSDNISHEYLIFNAAQDTVW